MELPLKKSNKDVLAIRTQQSIEKQSDEKLKARCIELAILFFDKDIAKTTDDFVMKVASNFYGFCKDNQQEINVEV